MNPVKAHQAGMAGRAGDVEAERAWVAARVAEWRQLEALGLLAGGLAHDLNNQITMIGHSVELAEMMDDPVRYRETCRQVQELCDQARRTIQRIQAFGRPGAGRRQVVELGEITQATLRLLRSSVDPVVELLADVQPVRLPVWANPNQVQEVLVHLVGVAVAEMPEAGGKIRVGVSEARSEADGPRPGRVWRLRLEGARAEPVLWQRILDGAPPSEGGAGDLADRVREVLAAHRATVWRDVDGGGLRISWPASEAEGPAEDVG